MVLGGHLQLSPGTSMMYQSMVCIPCHKADNYTTEQTPDEIVCQNIYFVTKVLTYTEIESETQNTSILLY